jgi:DnaJ-class molecular chaperone
MVVDTKLYDLLGVAPDVNERDLKRAYQKKAMALHPDKNRDDPDATEKFQQVNEAWEILKDPDRRRTYDQYGVEGLRQGGGGMDDILSHLFGGGGGFFGGGGGFFGGGGGGRGRGRQRTQDLQHKVSVSLEDLYNGKEITLKITRDIICPDCNGSGCVKGKSATKCRDCDGRGQRVQVIRMGPMITQQVSTCSTCRGTGEGIDPKDQCKKCKGRKTSEEKKTIVVHVTPGMSDGERLVFQGASDEAPGADTGDLIVFLQQKKHDHFLRKADDLLILKRITLSQALFGATFVLKHLDGRNLVVRSSPGQVIIPDAVKVIDNEGMPHRGDSYQKGKLYVKFEVVFPKGSQLTPELKAAFIAALPPPDEAAALDENDDNTYPVTMKDSDLKQFEQAKSSSDRRREAYNDDDDDRGGGGHGAQCQPM